MESNSVSEIMKVLSKGLLMGARGNSGVITSQIFRGIYQGVEGLDVVNGAQLAKALVNGSRVAYRAVMRPVEGTILTVVREAADYTYAYAMEAEDITCEQVHGKDAQEAKESLQRTPELLPVLAEVGVVDSGGVDCARYSKASSPALKGQPYGREEASSASVEKAGASMEGEEYGFCTEFIIRLSPSGARNFDENSMREELATIGNSIVCVRDDDIVKVHVHTLEPAKAVRMGRRHGTFLKLKAENMQEQHDNLIDDEAMERGSERAAAAAQAICDHHGGSGRGTEEHVPRSARRSCDQRRTDDESVHGRFRGGH